MLLKRAIMPLNRAIMLNYAHIYLTTLRTFFTMAVDGVLPLSDFLSDDLLQIFDDYESSSSNASLTVPVPAPPSTSSLKGSNTERKTKSDLNVWYN